MNNLIYRHASAIENNPLHQLCIVAYRQLSEILPTDDWAKMDRFLNNDKMWDELVNNSAIFVCEDGDKLVGSAYLVPSGNGTHIYPADWAYVRMVGVDPAYRGKG